MYKIKKEKNMWKILEVETQEYIFECRGERKCRDTLRSLNLGSGFKGHTPAFFNVSFK